MNTKYKSSPFAGALSTRCRNGLVGCFGDSDIINKPEKIAAGKARLILARNIGDVGLKEIAVALNKFGYIDDIDTWLKG